MNVSLNTVKRGLPKRPVNDSTSASFNLAKIVLCKSVTDGFPRIDPANVVPPSVEFNKFCKLIAAVGSNPELFPNAITWEITRMFILAFSSANGAPPPAAVIRELSMFFIAIANASHFMFDQLAVAATFTSAATPTPVIPFTAASVSFSKSLGAGAAPAPLAAAAAAAPAAAGVPATAAAATRPAAISPIFPPVIAFP